jgi:hypothetical protein
MSPVTEFAYIPLRPSSNIDDPSTSEGGIMAAMLEKGKVAPGVQRNYWGKLEENPKEIYLLLGEPVPSPGTRRIAPEANDNCIPSDWDSLEAHQTYQAQPHYGPFVAAAYSMVDPERSSMACHVAFNPHPPSAALLGPVAEVFIAHFSVEDAVAVTEAFPAQFGDFVRALVQAGVPGMTGEFTSGWAVEEQEHKGEMSKAFVAVVGWESVDAHKEAMKSAAYAQNSKLFTIAPKHSRISHVKFSSP